MAGFFSTIWGLITTLFWIVLIFAIAIGVIAFLGYNQLRHLSEAVKEAWSNVTVVQRKQISLLNQLQDVVSGYQESEKLVMLKVSDDASNASAVAQLYQQSGTVLTTVSGMAQKFPELKANEQYNSLYASTEACERQLEVARQKFNQVVKTYNVRRSSIPHVFYSTTLGFLEVAYLEFSGAEQTSDMGSLKSFSSDADGDRLNQLLGSAGGKALELSGKALESGRILTAKTIESGKALAENVQEKIRDISDKADKNNSMVPAPPPPPTFEPAAVLYYFLDESNTAKGPVKLDEIKRDIALGRLSPKVLVAVVGHTNWTAIADV